MFSSRLLQVPAVSATTKGGGLDALSCMVMNCGRQIWDCVSDGTCRAGLSCLNGCAFNDQVGRAAAGGLRQHTMVASVNHLVSRAARWSCLCLCAQCLQAAAPLQAGR
jgi:hypothetical protein